jgi:hypothetical protein
MWLLTSGSDPRCRSFVNADELSAIGHMTGVEYERAIHPDALHGIAHEDTVLVGWERDGERPRFLMVFRDDEHSRRLAEVQHAIQVALAEHAGILDLGTLKESLGRGQM